ncbi:50S ribosomal protein L21 [Candidatus Roizmanbacteria bacterium CG02_land_8_20_14_3_00_36_15]|uniref:Large ribosomal subunit protein bL21 n=2 Tax=Candidatus Roizmaniibacteriota TaxID=1752723 RepID=A0A2M8KMK3_9BACT|nr:MAG: 50S ribosomal protein L21 [Candidatus Roizmanbacteria bacterium CG03_land_8_20_14_0_80_36_21]PIV37621.1 MAG: 50S ribosomal protein L21 [Candidatus Roizmanbacteria bacterium CG02_land_8_20_14_3_00_36_15]PIY70211.1 MAG: 50S ribosomal protein L21 [Candidatus Roizmanbacteria bacterium CG_4_10_14_0_8_um_filter_36_36]PJA53065.1 MAG: 50S ribosomal protein L21 [Candidatus Roizmanbacteria bacterium CG_4_9_14_3_um_filter_36_11]PJC82095.1 MAG: 50S ribosomal protein L21 [Candidatus Roizmanbacteria 
MTKIAVIKSGGKQYLVKEGDEIIVDQLPAQVKDKVELDTLAVFDETGKQIDLGTPFIKTKVTAELVENLKGDKIRVAKFKAKVRYRKVKGFRPRLTKIKIIKI